MTRSQVAWVPGVEARENVLPHCPPPPSCPLLQTTCQGGAFRGPRRDLEASAEADSSARPPPRPQAQGGTPCALPPPPPVPAAHRSHTWKKSMLARTGERFAQTRLSFEVPSDVLTQPLFSHHSCSLIPEHLPGAEPSVGPRDREVSGSEGS